MLSILPSAAMEWADLFLPIITCPVCQPVVGGGLGMEMGRFVIERQACGVCNS